MEWTTTVTGPYIDAKEQQELIVVHPEKLGAALRQENLHVPGAKADDKKLDISNALVCLYQITEFGAKKYLPNGWRKVRPNRRYLVAALRHLLALLSGEKLDPESGLPHAGHILACICFWYEIDLEESCPTRKST